MENQDQPLRELVAAILANDSALVSRMLAAAPCLSTASFRQGATRQSAQEFFLEAIRRYVINGDTALHIAAAGYQVGCARKLVEAGANVRAQNRHGDEPLHASASGQPGSLTWNPDAQAAMIAYLVQTGADPNARKKQGVTPLHIAVRTRSALAVRALIECGADPSLPNKNGSAPILLAKQNTGRGGSGSPEAKAQQEEIVRVLEQALGKR